VDVNHAMSLQVMSLPAALPVGCHWYISCSHGREGNSYVVYVDISTVVGLVRSLYSRVRIFM